MIQRERVPCLNLQLTPLVLETSQTHMHAHSRMHTRTHTHTIMQDAPFNSSALAMGPAMCGGDAPFNVPGPW